MKLPHQPLLPARQSGAASIVIAMLLMFILVAAVMSVMKISGSSVFDAANNEEQISALFLADSGLERALSNLRTAALTNTYSDTTCTDLSGQSANLGRGSFTYTGALSTPTTCTGGSCTQCLVTVRGAIGATSSRTVQAQLIATQQNGTTGQTNTGCPTANCTPDVKMNMTVQNANSFAFVHILFNPTSNWGGSPVTPSCKDTGSGSLTACTVAWNITGNYYNNPASIGVYASIPSAGIYSITEEVLTTLPSTDSRHNYAAVGAIFHSLGGTSGLVGSFAKSPATTGTFPNKHVACPIPTTTSRTQPLVASDCNPYDYQHAYLDSGWTCNPSGVGNTTPNWSNAGNADTLLAGFGGKPYYPGTNGRCGNLNGVNYYHSGTQRCSNELNGLAVNGQPLFMQLSLDGQQGDYMYSQLWWTYNSAYYATTANATNFGASFTAAIGATFTGQLVSLTAPKVVTATSKRTGNSRNVLTVVSGAALAINDTLSAGSNNCSSDPFPSGATVTGLGTGTVTLDTNASQNCVGGTFTFAHPTGTILQVTNRTIGSGLLEVGNNVYYTSNGLSIGATIASPLGGTPAGDNGTYTLNPTNLTAGAAVGMYTTSAKLTVTSVSSGTLDANDVISGTGVASGTTLTGNASAPYLPYTGTTGTGLAGTYQLNVGGVAQPQHVIPEAMHTSSTTITLSGASTTPSVGTALGVVAGTGQFLPDSVTGCIGSTTSCSGSTPNCSGTGTTLQVCVASGTPNLSAGDALFGAGIHVNTVITARVSGTGGTGTYTIMPIQVTVRGTIIARAAVVGVPTANSFNVSRLPDTALVNAQICGGLCPILLGDGVHTIGEVDLSNIVDYDDWSSGFSCVKGIDPANILTVVNVMSKQAGWSEVVK